MSADVIAMPMAPKQRQHFILFEMFFPLAVCSFEDIFWRKCWKCCAHTSAAGLGVMVQSGCGHEGCSF